MRREIVKQEIEMMQKLTSGVSKLKEKAFTIELTTAENEIDKNKFRKPRVTEPLVLNSANNNSPNVIAE